ELFSFSPPLVFSAYAACSLARASPQSGRWISCILSVRACASAAPSWHLFGTFAVIRSAKARHPTSVCTCGSTTPIRPTRLHTKRQALPCGRSLIHPPSPSRRAEHAGTSVKSESVAAGEATKKRGSLRGRASTLLSPQTENELLPVSQTLGLGVM